MKKIIGNIAIALAFAFLIYSIVMFMISRKNNTELYIFGYKPYIITTGSMEPTLKIYSFAIVKRGNYENIKESDIITFTHPGFTQNICHRAIAIDENGITTKGDNNSVADLPKVTEANYVGKVVFKTNVTSYIANMIKR